MVIYTTAIQSSQMEKSTKIKVKKSHAIHNEIFYVSYSII